MASRSTCAVHSFFISFTSFSILGLLKHLKMALIAPEDPCPSYYRYVINVLACVLILVIFFCRYSPQGHLWSANHCVIHPPLICPPLYHFPGCAYGPSNPFDYPPPLSYLRIGGDCSHHRIPMPHSSGPLSRHIRVW